MIGNLSVSSLQNLEELLSPSHYGIQEPLPHVPKGTPAVPAGLTVQGLLSKDCMWGSIYNGPVVRCFPIKTHANADLFLGRGHIPVSINTTGYHFPGSIVKCATELSTNLQRPASINKLLLGLDCANDGGALVIYDTIRGQPMKWINLPAAVTSVTVLSQADDDYNHPFFNESLMAMVGVAAVGLQGGKILIVDLGLDHLEVSEEARKQNNNYYTTNKKWDIIYVEPHEPLIVQKRRTATMNKRLICLDVGNQDEEGDEDLFYYMDKAGNLIGSYLKEQVFVSSLKYVPTIGSLIVGFNFGGLQIRRVDDYQLEFSTDVGVHETAVHSIEFQQPVDDPKNFCYLWVLHGSRSAEFQHSHAVLYALFFTDRNSSGSSSLLFENLESCSPRLNISLQDFYNVEDEDSELDLSLNSTRYLVRPIRMWNQGENLTCFSWESSREGACYLGIFDLNQWYSCQTPGQLECVGENRLNPYWVASCFRNPMDVKKNNCSQLWDVRIIPRTMERWENQFSKHDIHFYPASITFQAVGLTSVGTFVFENFCIQEKLLRLVQRDGYQLMCEPATLKKLCSGFGLDPYCSMISEGKVSDQFYVFTSLLENYRPALIIQMANRWVDGSMSNLGCDIELILRWISHLTLAIRIIADEHWLNLVKFRRDYLPPDTSQFINYSNFIWNQLNGILETLIRHDRVYQDEEMNDDIAKLQYSLSRLIPYSSALLMMHKAQILPVMEEYDVITPLKASCEERRAQVKESLEKCKHLEPEYRQCHTLLIDYLLENFDEEFLCAEWDVKPGEQIYPPKHPAFIFNMLIGNWVDIDQKIIARVIFYFILDVMNLVGQRTTLRGDFTSLIQLTPTEQQEVVEIWRIDHGDFHDPITFLSQKCEIDESGGLPWSAALVHIIAQGSPPTPVIDILSRCCPPKLGKYCVGLTRKFFRCGDSDYLLSLLGGLFSFDWRMLLLTLVSDAYPNKEDKFRQIVSSHSFAGEINLLFHCFEKAAMDGFLGNFIDMHSRHTPIAVQQALVAYLEQPPLTFNKQQLLLLFFIKRKDADRAVEQYNKMKKICSDVRNLSPAEKEIWAERTMGVNRFLKSVRNDMLEFLGFTKQTSFPRLSPLGVNSVKNIPRTPPGRSILPGTVLPVIQRVIQSDVQVQMRKGATPLSPMKRYSGRIKPTVIVEAAESSIVSSEDSKIFGTKSSQIDAEITGKIDLDRLLETPRVDYSRSLENSLQPEQKGGISRRQSRPMTESVDMDETSFLDTSVRPDVNISCDVLLKESFASPEEGPSVQMDRSQPRAMSESRDMESSLQPVQKGGISRSQSRPMTESVDTSVRPDVNISCDVLLKESFASPEAGPAGQMDRSQSRAMSESRDMESSLQPEQKGGISRSQSRPMTESVDTSVRPDVNISCDVLLKESFASPEEGPSVQMDRSQSRAMSESRDMESSLQPEQKGGISRSQSRPMTESVDTSVRPDLNISCDALLKGSNAPPLTGPARRRTRSHKRAMSESGDMDETSFLDTSVRPDLNISCDALLKESFAPPAAGPAGQMARSQSRAISESRDMENSLQPEQECGISRSQSRPITESGDIETSFLDTSVRPDLNISCDPLPKGSNAPPSAGPATRMTRNHKRAMSEIRDMEASFPDISARSDLDISTVALLDGSGTTSTTSKRRRKSSSVSAAEVSERIDSKKGKAGPSGRSRRKADSEPRDTIVNRSLEEEMLNISRNALLKGSFASPATGSARQMARSQSRTMSESRDMEASFPDTSARSDLDISTNALLDGSSTTRTTSKRRRKSSSVSAAEISEQKVSRKGKAGPSDRSRRKADSEPRENHFFDEEMFNISSNALLKRDIVSPASGPARQMARSLSRAMSQSRDTEYSLPPEQKGGISRSPSRPITESGDMDETSFLDTSVRPDLNISCDALLNESFAPPTSGPARRMTRSQSRAVSESRDMEASFLDTSARSDLDISTDALLAGSGTTRTTSKRRRKSSSVSANEISEQKDSIKGKPGPSSRSRRKADSEPRDMRKLLHSPEDVFNRPLGEEMFNISSNALLKESFTSPATGAARRMTRSQSRAMSESRDMEASFLDTSADLDISSDALLDGSGTTSTTSKRRRKSSSVSAAEVSERKDPRKAKAGPSGRSRRKADSEPRDMRNLLHSPDDLFNQSFDEEKSFRRPVLSFAPGLSTVLEVSESSSQLKTPTSGDRR